MVEKLGSVEELAWAVSDLASTAHEHMDGLLTTKNTGSNLTKLLHET